MLHTKIFRFMEVPLLFILFKHLHVKIIKNYPRILLLRKSKTGLKNTLQEKVVLTAFFCNIQYGPRMSYHFARPV